MNTPISPSCGAANLLDHSGLPPGFFTLPGCLPGHISRAGLVKPCRCRGDTTLCHHCTLTYCIHCIQFLSYCKNKKSEGCRKKKCLDLAGLCLAATPLSIALRTAALENRRTLAAIITKLNAELARVLRILEIEKRLEGDGVEIAANSPEQFRAYIGNGITK